jgi:RNA polymerase sigma-70 factor (ECF subfamily)
VLDRATRWFLRWRDRGDAAALGRLFDGTAPELLRIALNLSRNVADAEDLVQATFLAAIEGATRFERGRRVVPWLVAILTHAAQADRRRRLRAPSGGAEPDERASGDADPGERAAARELAQHGRDALDRLPEPYRQPILLRVAHGLQPAEIALLLGRSPGTVRAQIHRGLERLRRRLPAGALAPGMYGSGLVGRGLPSVKSAVLVHAARQSVAAAAAGVAVPASTLTGAFVMSKKILAAAVLLLAGLTFAIVRPGAGPAAAPERDAPAPAAAAAATLAPTAAHEAPAGRSLSARTTAPYEPGPDAIRLRGRVVDGTSRRPIAEATIAVFPPRRVTLLDVQREFGEFGWPLPDGTMTGMVEWLRDAPESTVATTVGGGLVDYLLPPKATDAPLAQLRTDTEGRFEVALVRTGALVAIAHPGFGTRYVPVRRLPLHADDPPVSGDDSEPTLPLWPVRRLVGHVRTANGEPPPRPLDLLFTDASGFPASGAWLATTDRNGAFAAEVAATKVGVASRTRGWIVRGVATDDAGLPAPTGSLQFDVGTFAAVQVARFGSAVLHVTDAATHRPIETIRVTATDENESARWCGTFAAKDGWFELGGFRAEDIAIQRAVGLDQGFPKHLGATVWSPGYRPARVDEVVLYADEPAVVEVALERGELAHVEGRVVRGDAPVAGVTVSLRLFRRIHWHEEAPSVVAAATTGGDGAFDLAAPAGDLLLEVATSGSVQCQQIATVPSSGLVVDLAAAVHVVVEVVDADGHPVADHNCMVTNGSGNQRAGRTGSDGRATFGPFAAGRLSAHAPREATRGSWAGEIEAEVDAAPGSQLVVQLRLPRNDRFRAHLAFDGQAPERGFAGFSARDVSVTIDGKDVPVEADGTVPIDLRPGARLLVAGANGRQWRLTLPAALAGNPTLLLRWSGLGYTGVLTDVEGRPFAHGRVFAAPTADIDATVSAVTDAGGAFHLDGLAPGPHVLSFHTDAGAQWREIGRNALARVWFEPASPPSSPPAQLRLQLPRAAVGDSAGAMVAITARVRNGAGDPVPNAIVAVTTLFAGTDGVLQLYPEKSWQYADNTGAVQVQVARGDRYRAWVRADRGGKPLVEEWPVTGASDERTFVLR